MSKIDRAIEIVKSNPTSSRGDLIAKFMSDLGMSKAGATTYFYNATKGMERTAKTVSAVKAAKVLPVKEPAKPVATAAQIMKAAEKARKIKEEEAAKIRAELEEFVNDIEGYTFPNGTLAPLRAPKVVDQDKIDEIKEKNLSVMKKVQKTFIQDVA
jgi:ribosomal protein L3